MNVDGKGQNSLIGMQMEDLLRGKNSEQQSIIRFFYGADGGCGSSGMTSQQYEQMVSARLSTLDTKKMALSKLGIDEEEVHEIEPVSFAGYKITEKQDNLAARATNGSWLSSDYETTWLFFGNEEVFIYQYSFSMISNSKRESAMQYFYRDVTNFTTASETYQKWVAMPGGCNSNKPEYVQQGAESNEFKIIVPGDTLRCAMGPNDLKDETIRGMRNKLREKKNSN